MKFAASVTADGTIRIHDHHRRDRWTAQRLDQRIEVELRDAAAIRSDRQNRYWWAVCVPFVQECWQRERGARLPLPKEAVHDALMTAFGGGWIDTPLGRARNSSARMKVDDFTRLIESVQEYALTKYEAVLPTPEDWSEA